jgi:hypothetical protein
MVKKHKRQPPRPREVHRVGEARECECVSVWWANGLQAHCSRSPPDALAHAHKVLVELGDNLLGAFACPSLQARCSFEDSALTEARLEWCER